MMSNGRPRVVIVGAGFAGLWAMRTLAKSDVDVLLIDRNNYHTFLPLLYQVAAAEIEPEDIAYTLRNMLHRRPNVQYMMSDVIGLDISERLLHTKTDKISYDYLILAVGSVSHFFGVSGAAEHAFELKTLNQAIVLRNHILCCFEKATREHDAEERRRLLTFAIVGGGPTGVEFAGALIELLCGPFPKDYPTIDFGETRVLLLEAREALLPGLAACASEYAERRLRRMGVDVRLHAQVAGVTANQVLLSDGTVIPTRTTVWTAGIRGDPFAESWGLPVSADKRVLVEPTLQVPGHAEVYVVGDLAHVEQDGVPLAMLAPVAIQEGTHAAENVLRTLAHEAPRTFRYRDRGTMVTIGRGKAVAHLSVRRCITGFPAWVAWLGVHLFSLIGFRNRVSVLLDWARDYLFYDRAVRLILRSD